MGTTRITARKSRSGPTRGRLQPHARHSPSPYEIYATLSVSSPIRDLRSFPASNPHEARAAPPISNPTRDLRRSSRLHFRMRPAPLLQSPLPHGSAPFLSFHFHTDLRRSSVSTSTRDLRRSPSPHFHMRPAPLLQSPLPHEICAALPISTSTRDLRRSPNLQSHMRSAPLPQEVISHLKGGQLPGSLGRTLLNSLLSQVHPLFRILSNPQLQAGFRSFYRGRPRSLGGSVADDCPADQPVPTVIGRKADGDGGGATRLAARPPLGAPPGIRAVGGAPAVSRKGAVEVASIPRSGAGVSR